MRIITNIILWGLMTPLLSCSQQINEDLKYLQQTPPSDVPEVFAPGLVSKESVSEFGSVFNREGTSFFYGVDKNGLTEIRHSKLIGSKWSEPKTILSHEKFGFNDPFLSPDEQRLYFISERTMDGQGAKQDHDIWYVERESSGWSESINAGSNINTNKSEYYISFTKNGTMYFSSNKTVEGGKRNGFDIYSSEFINGEFQPAISLGPSINTEHYEADVFVDPNESYVIFCARRPDGLGRGDLYISFKNTDGSWTPSKSMGDKINTEKHELCPFVSMDGKYLFYTSNQDIYWVSANIIDDLREGK